MDMLQRLAFESPVIAPAVVLLAGLVAAVVLAQRAKGRAAAGVLIVAVLLAAGVATASRLVTTDRERVIQQTRDMVAEFGQGDAGAAQTYISPRIVVAASGEQIRGIDRGMIETGVDRLDTVVTGLTPTVRSPTRLSEREIAVELGVRADLRLGGVYPSTWEVVWQDEGDAWRVVRLNALRLGDQDATTARFPRWSNSRGF
jgi:hypothetical protein